MRKLDLLSYIQKGNKKNKNGVTQKGCVIGYRYFGFLEREAEDYRLNNYIKRLQKVNPTDKWCVFHIMGVGSAFDKDGKLKEKSFFAYGSVLVLVPSNVPLYNWYSVEGTTRTALYDGTGSECYVAEMKKVDESWCVDKCKIEDLDLSFCSSTIENYIIESVNRGVFIQPKKPLEYIPVEAYTNNYDELKASEPEELGIEIEDVQIVEEVRKPESKPAQQPITDTQPPIVNNNSTDYKSIISARTDIDWDNTVRRSTKPFEPVTRLNLAEKSDKYKNISRSCDDSLVKLKSNIESLREKFDSSKDSDNEFDNNELRKLLNNILISAKRRPGGMGMSGQTIIKEYIEKQKESKRSLSGQTYAERILLFSIDNIIKYMLHKVGLSEENGQIGIEVTDFTEKTLDVLFPTDIQELYAGLYAVILGLDVSTLKELGSLCTKNNLSFIRIVRENPYLLVLLKTDSKFLMLETLANARGVNNNNTEWRLASILQEVLANDNGSTAFYLGYLFGRKLSLSIGKRGIEKVYGCNSLINQATKYNVNAYIDSNLTDKDWNYTSEGFNNYGQKILNRNELKEAIIAYVDAGLGTVYRDTLFPTNALVKEVYLYNRLYDNCTYFDDISDSDIEQCINDFEQIKAKELGIPNFKFEEEQRKAAYLVKWNVGLLTGPAGSGKTTSAELLVYVIKKLVKKKKLVISYAAPSGVAAKRLQSVVGENVKTMCSMFQVYGNESTVFDMNEEEDNSSSADVYIFDEQAMVPTSLMYNCISKISSKSRIYLLGDKEQLPPIGDGKPFADFLRFLPTVALSVCKRSAEGSVISKNNKIILENSDRNNYLPLEEGSDFKMTAVEDKDIISSVVDLCAYHLGKKSEEQLHVDNLLEVAHVVNEDDIQVISPKLVGGWGTEAMNEVLQDLFNPNTYEKASSVTFNVDGKIKTFRVGSRVLHNSNQYGFRHYSSVKGGCFVLKNKGGVMNGDIGKIVGIYEGKNCSYIEPSEGLEEYYLGYELDDCIGAVENNNIIVAVEYWDAEEECNYYILYTGIKSDGASTTSEIVLSFSNLSNIQLAYALTTHKMQGSENKIIIGVVGTGSSPIFINRNMLYTMQSRAKLGYYFIGNLSAIDNGRAYNVSNMRHTGMEELI